MNVQSLFAPTFIEAPGARLRVARFEPAARFRGICVLLNGQTEFIEKYFEVIGELGARGFAVATMDWRGQGGSTRPLIDPLKGHLADYGEHDADLAALMEQVALPMAAERGSRVVPIALAHSMGAHILLRYLHARPKDFSACGLSAPMIEIATHGLPGFVVAALANAMDRVAPTDWIWGAKGHGPLTRNFANQIVTHDRARFERAQDYLRAHRDLRLGGPTWGWLRATLCSIAEIEAPGYPEAIATPVLVCGAGADEVVHTGATRAYARRMPQAEYVEIPGAAHEILMETDAIRAQFWRAFDGFIAEHG